MNRPITREDVANAIQLVKAVADTIREAGEQGCPSGPLYAALNSKGIGIDNYNRIIATLKGAGVVEEKNHLLRWIGPKVGA